MNYTEIVNTSLAYADRAASAIVVNNMDNFIKVVESRVNRFLMTQQMSSIAETPIAYPTTTYNLPSDFLAERSIKVTQVETPTFAITLSLCNPEQMANLANNNSQFTGYMIIANSIEIWPSYQNATGATYMLEIGYYRRIVNLNSLNPNNWLGDIYPDCYIFGLATEINAFVKDVQATELWNQRFIGALDEISLFNEKATYSGNPICTKVG